MKKNQIVQRIMELILSQDKSNLEIARILMKKNQIGKMEFLNSIVSDLKIEVKGGLGLCWENGKRGHIKPYRAKVVQISCKGFSMQIKKGYFDTFMHGGPIKFNPHFDATIDKNKNEKERFKLFPIRRERDLFSVMEIIREILIVKQKVNDYESNKGKNR